MSNRSEHPSEKAVHDALQTLASFLVADLAIDLENGVFQISDHADPSDGVYTYAEEAFGNTLQAEMVLMVIEKARERGLIGDRA